MKSGPESVPTADRVLKVVDGRVGMLLRAATTRAKVDTEVSVEWVEDHPQGPMMVSREIDKIVVSGSGRITIHLKDA